MSQNQSTASFISKRILIIWAVLSLTLAFSGILALELAPDFKKFILIANALNLFFLALYFFFRKNIENTVARLINKSQKNSFQIEYKHENIIGYTLLSFFIVIGMTVIYFSLFDIKGYSFLIQEDGIVEYGSAFFWFLAALVMFFKILVNSKNEKNKTELLFNVGLIVFFIACCGEEISWGQRLFEINTPDLLKDINVQNEITLHNIGSISIFSNAFFLLTILFFICIPLMIKNERIKRVLYFLKFPVPNRFARYVYWGTLVIWVFVGCRFGTLGFHPFSFFPEQYYNQMDDEIFEFFSAYSFFSFSLLNSTMEITKIKKD